MKYIFEVIITPVVMFAKYGEYYYWRVGSAIHFAFESTPYYLPPRNWLNYNVDGISHGKLMAN